MGETKENKQTFAPNQQMLLRYHITKLTCQFRSPCQPPYSSTLLIYYSNQTTNHLASTSLTVPQESQIIRDRWD